MGILRKVEKGGKGGLIGMHGEEDSFDSNFKSLFPNSVPPHGFKVLDVDKVVNMDYPYCYRILVQEWHCEGLLVTLCVREKGRKKSWLYS